MSTFTRSTTLYVTNLPGDVALEDLQRFFGDTEGFLSSRLRRTRQGGQMVAFVEFGIENDAATALEAYDGASFTDSKGRTARLVVEFAKSAGVRDSGPSRVGHKRAHEGDSGRRSRSSSPDHRNGYGRVSRNGNGSEEDEAECGVRGGRRGGRSEAISLSRMRERRSYAASPEESRPGSASAYGSPYPYGQASEIRRADGPVPEGASRILFVGNLPPTITERELAHVFRPFAGYESLRIARASDRFIAFVTFESETCATVSLWNLQGYRLDLRTGSDTRLRVEYSKPSNGQTHDHRSDCRSAKRLRRDHPDPIVDTHLD